MEILLRFPGQSERILRPPPGSVRDDLRIGSRAGTDKGRHPLNDPAKHVLVKAVSAFSNRSGGVLLIGPETQKYL